MSAVAPCSSVRSIVARLASSSSTVPVTPPTAAAINIVISPPRVERASTSPPRASHSATASVGKSPRSLRHGASPNETTRNPILERSG